MRISRRDFVSAALASSFAVGTKAQEIPRSEPERPQPPASPAAAGKRIILCAANGYRYLDDAFALLANGGDPLDAALRVVKGPEDDPHDDSVGLGGLPNEEGVVELDACCMHGPTRRAGSVAGVRNIKNVSLLAKAVMQHTGHVMLVGEGAERFAVAQGFLREDLLTDNSRKTWLLWKETHSDWWGPGLADPNWRKRFPRGPQSQHSEEWRMRIRRMEQVAADLGIEAEMRMPAIRKVFFPPTGTIHCSALNDQGSVSGCTTTSGLAWKIPGRVGDSPIIGAGCYTDQDVGSAGATGSGEENIKVAGAFSSVALGQAKEQKPDTPVGKWTGKTIMLIGAHADDDMLSHGTMAMLQAHGNQVYVVTLTTGNVGTQDPKLSRTQLAQIRRQEELAALAELGIPGDHYINLGYDDGLLEFEDRKSVVESLVRLIRKMRPDVLMAWDPGKNYQRWHKSDHRAASYLAADAARAAMWRLLFEGQITQEGLTEYMIPEYLFYNDYDPEDENTWVDISDFLEKKVNAATKYVSQFGPGWKNYKAHLSESELKQMKDESRQQVRMKDGKPVEGFRYYKGLPDALGK